MTVAFLSFAFFSVLVQVTTQSCSFSWPPPNTFAGPKPIFVNGDTFTANWTSDFQEVELVLWNDWHSAQGTEGVYRLLRMCSHPPLSTTNLTTRTGDKSPDPSSFGGKLTVSLDQGSSFHLVLYETSSGKELGPQCDTISFEMVDSHAVDGGTGAGASSVIASILSTAQLTGTTAAPNPTPTSFSSDTFSVSVDTSPEPSSEPTARASIEPIPSSLPSSLPSALVASLIAAASNNAAAAQASRDAAYNNPPQGLPQGAVLGLGLGLGLGLPALIAATVLITLCLVRRRSTGSSVASTRRRSRRSGFAGRGRRVSEMPTEAGTEAGTMVETGTSGDAGAGVGAAGLAEEGRSSRAAGTISPNARRGPTPTPRSGALMVERYA